MLVAVPDRAAVVACSTCHAGTAGPAAAGGARLIEVLRAIGAEPGYESVAVEAMPCLFACAAPCAVHLRAPGRIGYVLGHFAPDPAAARAILDYAVRYASSSEGEVPYGDWPEAVKGHFLARVPPPGHLVA